MLLNSRTVLHDYTFFSSNARFLIKMIKSKLQLQTHDKNAVFLESNAVFPKMIQVDPRESPRNSTGV